MKTKIFAGTINKIIIAFSLIAMVFFSFPNYCYADVHGNSSEHKIMVSLGDSFSSGEGIPPFYWQNMPLTEKVNISDWAAHRSTLSWPGMLKLPSLDYTMSEYKNTGDIGVTKSDYWFFVATSGATTEHMNQWFKKEYNKSIFGANPGLYYSPVVKGYTYIEPQLSIFDELNERGLSADYVTMTLGGNDVGFTNVVIDAVLSSTFLNPNYLTDVLNNTWQEFFSNGGTKDRLRETYLKIAEKAGEQAHVIIAGYPKLLDPNGSAVLFSKESARELNRAVSQFNDAIKSIIESIVFDPTQLKGKNIYFVSVEEAFEGHSAYSNDPYINGVMFGSQSEDLVDSLIMPSGYSMHPNYFGACTYASCVQSKINEIENAEMSTYNLNFALTVYDNDNSVCGNYVVEIEGEQFTDPFGWGLMRQAYADIINVDDSKTENITLPKGDYSITVRDGTNTLRFSKRDITVRADGMNNILEFYTNFGRNPSDDKLQYTIPDVLPQDAVEFNGHYYYLYSDGIANSYDDALQYCINKGGYLATLTSKEENDFVYSYIKGLGCRSAYFGLSDEANEGNWVWCTGEPLSYTNWHSGEPNNENSSENYAMYYFKFSDGSWNDGDFGVKTENGGKAFICEWGDYETTSIALETNSPESRAPDYSLYIPVLKNAVAEGDMEGYNYALLYDIDGDATDELFMLHSIGSMIQVFSVYDIENGALKTKAEKQELVWLAGSQAANAGIVRYDGNDYFFTESHMGDYSDGQSLIVLYCFETMTPEHEIKQSVKKNAQGVWETTTAIDGKSATIDEYYAIIVELGENYIALMDTMTAGESARCLRNETTTTELLEALCAEFGN